MNQRIELDGYPVNIETKESEKGFRTEIMAMTDAPIELNDRLFRQATSWSRELSAGRDNASVHCFRANGTIIIESLGAKASGQEMLTLSHQLGRPLAAGAAAGIDQLPWDGEPTPQPGNTLHPPLRSHDVTRVREGIEVG